MQLSVKGKQLDVGDALRTHVDESLSRILDKYFGDALEVAVTLSREAHLYRAVISAHVGRGIQMEAQGEANEPYPAFDAAADRMSKRLRRYKRRLRDHNSKTAEAAPLPAQQYILAGEGPEESEDESNADGQPAVVAEMTTEIPTLTVSEAVMRMDLANLPAMMFRNSAHGGLNMIYQRSDGNIGWIDPRGNRGE
ncbi:ribosome hibernation-promoting factor, HPF/YfiA family [Pelagibius sp. 7325]|uniref:ribosome hibernation-promoting factor, HPF/YfiA family n=1 Tax=Pelagibius sp. 7325 TaxID=3131994 RepID=UPI0030ECF231